ncbi:MAG: hypothetical protein VKJ24_09930 [Synechococcales bacterium]|nr:hypothetical protein [Synechococcales bacterium]
MKKSEESFLSNFLAKRISFLELVLTAFFAAFGINLISSSLPALLNLNNQWMLGIGILLCVLPLLYYLCQAFRQRSETQIYEGFLVFNSQDKKIIAMPEYHFLEFAKDELNKIVRKSESDLITQWNATVDLNADPENRNQLIRYMTDYYVLWVLSKSLKEHYAVRKRPGKHSISAHHTDSFREIQQNDFIECNTKSAGNFLLTLPKNSKVGWTDEMKGILIEMPGCMIEVNSDFWTDIYHGIASKIKFLVNLPEDQLACFKVEISIKVTYKTGVMFLFGSSLYRYQWIEKFLQDIHSKFAETAFFEAINWSPSTEIVLNNILQQRSQSPHQPSLHQPSLHQPSPHQPSPVNPSPFHQP